MTRSHPRGRRPAAPTLVRPRPTRLVPAAVPVPDGVFAPARRDPSIHASPGREIEPLTAGRRRPGRGVELEITGVRPEWADLQRVPPLEVVVSRDRIERRARAKALTPVTLAHEALRFTYPWCTIGSVRSGYHPNYDVAISGGTGVLVGPNLMLTASHVAPWGHGPAGWWMEFTPAFNAQHSVPKPFGSSFVDSYRGIKYASDASPGGTDYVICKLYEPLGKKVGWMGTRSYGDENKYYDQPFTSVGYPTDFQGRPIVDFDIYVKDIDGDGSGLELETLYAKAFGGGWSGGPLWSSAVDGSDPRVYGIKSGWEVDGYDPARGVFAGGGYMVELVKYGLANWT